MIRALDLCFQAGGETWFVCAHLAAQTGVPQRFDLSIRQHSHAQKHSFSHTRTPLFIFTHTHTDFCVSPLFVPIVSGNERTATQHHNTLRSLRTKRSFTTRITATSFFEHTNGRRERENERTRDIYIKVITTTTNTNTSTALHFHHPSPQPSCP